MDYRETVERIAASGADVVFNTIVPPGVTPFFEELHDSGFTSRGGQLICTYFDENFLNMVPAAHVEGLYGCLDYYQAVDDPFSRKLLEQYDALYPGDAKFTGGSACSGLYRGLRLWAAAVTEAGSLRPNRKCERHPPGIPFNCDRHHGTIRLGSQYLPYGWGQPDSKASMPGLWQANGSHADCAR